MTKQIYAIIYAECLYVECRYAKCRGALNIVSFKIYAVIILIIEINQNCFFYLKF
jgi:hypothetical protein